jgi:hypothetical protein
VPHAGGGVFDDLQGAGQLARFLLSPGFAVLRSGGNQ